MRKGFTLIELVVVIIVIGILATLAVPQYLKATERAKGAKAKNALALIAQAEILYRAEKDTYTTTVSDQNNTTLGSYVELNAVDADTDWDYVVGAAGAATFTATATRVAGGSCGGGRLTVNQNGAWGGAAPCGTATGSWNP